MTDHVSEQEQVDTPQASEPAAPPPPAAEEATARDPQEPAEVPVIGNRSRWTQRPRLAWTVAAVAGVLALVGIAGSVWFGTQWADLYAEDRARQQVRQAATDVVTRLTTFEGENIEEWLSAAQGQATGDYKQQLAQVFDQANRDALREIRVVSRGKVESLFVQDVQDETATAFAVVRQTYVNARTTEPVEDQLRIDLTLQLVNDEWLASEVAVLGPPGVLAPTVPGTGDE